MGWREERSRRRVWEDRWTSRNREGRSPAVLHGLERASAKEGGTHETGSDQLLACREVPVLVLLDERLELVRRERVNPTALAHDE